MTKVTVKFSPGVYERFRLAYEYFMKQYYPVFGGPTFSQFVLLCAEHTCNDILSEKGESKDDA